MSGGLNTKNKLRITLYLDGAKAGKVEIETIDDTVSRRLQV
jgi:hypothetical protein